ncbi:hypothetical protein QTN25_003157 [Entamoeba marina]
MDYFNNQIQDFQNNPSQDKLWSFINNIKDHKDRNAWLSEITSPVNSTKKRQQQEKIQSLQRKMTSKAFIGCSALNRQSQQNAKDFEEVCQMLFSLEKGVEDLKRKIRINSSKTTTPLDSDKAE